MMKRLEFTKPVRIEIFKRAGGPNDLRCERCTLRLMGKAFEVDHIVECWEMLDEWRDRPLTASDGMLLCIPCHDAKSGKKAGERAHCNRIVAKAAGVKPRSSFQTNRNSPWKKKMDGTVERRS